MNRSNPGEVCRTRGTHELPWYDPILGPFPVQNGPRMAKKPFTLSCATELRGLEAATFLAPNAHRNVLEHFSVASRPAGQLEPGQ